MSEIDDLQATKDDPGVWGDALPLKRARKRLDAVISVRFTPDEEQAIRREAERRGVSLSELVRQSVLKELRPRPQPGGSYAPGTTSAQAVHQVRGVLAGRSFGPAPSLPVLGTGGDRAPRP